MFFFYFVFISLTERPPYAPAPAPAPTTVSKLNMPIIHIALPLHHTNMYCRFLRWEDCGKDTVSHGVAFAIFFYTVLHRKSYFEALSIRKVLRMLLTIGQGFTTSAFKGPNLNFHQCQRSGPEQLVITKLVFNKHSVVCITNKHNKNN